MKCVSCGSYFKRTPWTTGNECEDCEAAFVPSDVEEKAELDILLNPSGKTQPVFYDEQDYDSHGL